MPQPSTRQFDWSGRMESLEERLPMSADPLGGLLGGAIGHHATIEEPPAPDHHVESAPDFWIDYDNISRIEDDLRQIDKTLEEAHDQQGLNNIIADYGFTGIGQTVAVIDSGIAYDHFALGGGFGSNYRVVGGWDFTDENDADPFDDGPAGSHGTHVAGIVGGDSAVDHGVASGVDFVALRVFDDAGNGYFSWVENALDWIHTNRNTFENPITAINLSLGVATWNSDTIPAWANLEDEFAQLKADGIFISVSAGNSFTTYNTPGLSYPAASQHVVPVMSVDNDGNLSYYSQRHSRAIAAPGRSITSTVTDYDGNNNGLADDYGTKSGTSMSAPYVAGASVLIREAMEFAGYSNITQDTIFDHMVATADSFFDSATNAWYDRLNLEAAIDALMPADDYGSTIATAFSLGTVSNPIAMSGTIGTLNDIDYFTFTAADTGTVTFTSSNMTHELGASWSVTGGTAATSGVLDEIYTVDVSAGQSYTVGFLTDNGLGHYDLDITAEASFTYTDWGTVSFNELTGLSVVDDSWYRVEAGSAGYLTVEALFDVAGNQVSLEFYDTNLQLIDTGNAANGTSRVDVYAAAGQEMFVKIVGTNSDVDFRLTNLVSLTGTVVDVAGTTSDDQFDFTAGTTHQVSVNGVSYDFAAIAITDVVFNGGAGADTITMTGTVGDETATLYVGNAALAGSGFTATVTGVENVTISSGGGDDIAYLYDSAGDDLFQADPVNATMSGNGYVHTTTNFNQTYAYATNGGTDNAQLYDGATDDRFIAHPEYGLLYGVNNEFYRYANGFDQVHAYATNGGNDISYLYDGATDDIFVAHPEYGLLRGANNEFYNYADGFDRVHAYATAGGSDNAYLYDGATDDQFVGKPEYGLLRGLNDEFYNYASGFNQVFAYATAGGSDWAYLYDGATDDRFIGRPEYGLMYGVNNEFYNYANGFDRVHAYGTAGGTDYAHLYDGTTDDRFIARPEYGLLYAVNNEFYHYANGFDRTHAYATAGGTDYAHLYDGASDDLFVARPEYGLLYGTGNEFYNYAAGFERVHAYATAGGTDYSYLYDGATNDQFVAKPEYGLLRGMNDEFYNYAAGFDRVQAYATGGGIDNAYLYDSASDDFAFAEGDSAYLTGADYINLATGFALVQAHSINGGTDIANESAIDFVFEKLGNWV